jgi:hypothetical protein
MGPVIADGELGGRHLPHGLMPHRPIPAGAQDQGAAYSLGRGGCGAAAIRARSNSYH